MEYAQNRDAGAKAVGDVYEPGNDCGGNVEANLEVFKSTIEEEDYVMGEMQQRAAEDGTWMRSSSVGTNPRSIISTRALMKPWVSRRLRGYKVSLT